MVKQLEKPATKSEVDSALAGIGAVFETLKGGESGTVDNASSHRWEDGNVIVARLARHTRRVDTSHGPRCRVVMEVGVIGQQSAPGTAIRPSGAFDGREGKRGKPIAAYLPAHYIEKLAPAAQRGATIRIERFPTVSETGERSADISVELFSGVEWTPAGMPDLSDARVF